jgi:hypothetical protein
MTEQDKAKKILLNSLLSSSYDPDYLYKPKPIIHNMLKVEGDFYKFDVTVFPDDPNDGPETFVVDTETGRCTLDPAIFK